jgi:glycerophosphoryl diester phosphodiesterase
LEHTFTPLPVRNNRPIVRIGHRGAAGHAPENTLAAIRTGISLGSDFIELDVQSTRDGRLAVLHDASVDRTTNGTGPISSLTWDQLQSLDAGNGERVPSVEAALAAVNGHAGVMLEVKAPGIGPALYRTVQSSTFSGPVIYASFLHAEILAIHKLDPRTRTMALIEQVSPSGAAFAHDVNAALVGLSFGSATPQFVATLHVAGLEVFLYTVNEPSMIRHAIRLDVDGIISDYPDRVPKTRPPEDSR